jgi:hypothetical protein
MVVETVLACDLIPAEVMNAKIENPNFNLTHIAFKNIE